MTKVTANNVPATATATATSAATDKPKGIRRVTNIMAAKGAVSRFTMATPIGAKVALDDSKAVLDKVKAADLNLTEFGHKALDSGVRAATAVIDAWLVSTAKQGHIDVKALIDSTFNAITTTSRVSGQPAEQQVMATYKKVIDHLGTFCKPSQYQRYLAKRLDKKGYTPADSKAIFQGFSQLAMITRENVLDGRKAAAAHYKNK
jgi:post-segregation antitoxin (ccd killing protein)